MRIILILILFFFGCQNKESGINSYVDIERVKNAGANAVLVGESLVTSTDPGVSLSGLI